MKVKEFIRRAHLKPWDGSSFWYWYLARFYQFWFWAITKYPTAAKQAVLRVDGKEIKEFDLIEGQDSYTYRYEDPDGDYNLIEIAGDRIRIKEADCGDQICVPPRLGLKKWRNNHVCHIN